MKLGDNIQELTGTNLLLGITEVYDGELRIRSQQPTARFWLDGGALSGDGLVDAITLQGGRVAPGAVVGRLKANSLVATQYSAIFDVELNGPIAGTSHDQLEVGTAPDVSKVMLYLTMGEGFAPTNGQQFVILRNTSGQPVKNRLVRPGYGGVLEEGHLFKAMDNQSLFQISYLGGTGHDVVLTKVEPWPVQFHSITTLPDGSKDIWVVGQPGLYYLVSANDDLGNDQGWVILEYVTPTPSGLVGITDTDAPNYPQRFYRFVPK